MRTLFIADLHLSENHPQVVAAFYRFLEKELNFGETLYILGDLFDVWVGDDEHTPLMDKVADALTKCAKKRQITIYYLHGNRDFMLGKHYAKQASMQRLPDHHEIDLYGQKALLLHGDTLCLADVNYQKMRKVIHNPIMQCIFNIQPLFMRKKIGLKIRTASQNKKEYKKRDDMGVTKSEVDHLLTKHASTLMIHGHTHQVNKHSFDLNGKSALRFDVGDWYQNLSFVVAQSPLKNQQEINLIVRPISYYD
ncbi:MAG TPA: UDP-2,3-diacylglucosamine diphosphatase [Psychromonas hadalis]|nr:UDP-2,3-diacylglucosamine diphosphatase [Psychromonas hadalis]